MFADSHAKGVYGRGTTAKERTGGSIEMTPHPGLCNEKGGVMGDRNKLPAGPLRDLAAQVPDATNRVLTDAHLAARVIEAHTLNQAADASTDADEATALREQAGNVLAAMPPVGRQKLLDELETTERQGSESERRAAKAKREALERDHPVPSLQSHQEAVRVVESARFRSGGSPTARRGPLTQEEREARAQPSSKAVDALIKSYQDIYNQIPAEVRKSLSPAEALARCREHKRSQELALRAGGELGRYYNDRARLVLKAMPAAEVEAEVQTMTALAEGTSDSVLKSAYRAKAAEVRQCNPQPTEEITKGALADVAKAAPARPQQTRWTRSVSLADRIAAMAATAVAESGIAGRIDKMAGEIESVVADIEKIGRPQPTTQQPMTLGMLLKHQRDT